MMVDLTALIEKKSYRNAFIVKLMKIFSSVHRLLFFSFVFWQHVLPVDAKKYKMHRW